jgi:hypothetical protein
MVAKIAQDQLVRVRRNYGSIVLQDSDDPADCLHGQAQMIGDIEPAHRQIQPPARTNMGPVCHSQQK